MRIPKKNFLKWLDYNYGVGGLQNYSQEQVNQIIEGLYLLLNNSAYRELDFLGKFFNQLSNDSEKADCLFEELRDWLSK